MTAWKTKEKDPRYHAAGDGIGWQIQAETTERLQQWASDPNCIEQEVCAKVLAERLAQEETNRVKREQKLARKREQLAANPFDPRNEVSADAKHIAGRIVMNLWMIFVALPFVLAVLYAILK